MCEGSPFGRFEGEGFSSAEVSLVGFGWVSAEWFDQHVMVGREEVGVLDGNGLEKAAVGAQDVVTARLVVDAKPCLGPGVEAPVLVALSKLGEKVGKAVRCKEIGDLVGPGGSGVLEVYIKIAQDNWRGGILVEAVEGFSEVRQAIKV